MPVLHSTDASNTENANEMMRPVLYGEARQILIWTVGLSYVAMVLCFLATKVSLDYEEAARAYVVAAIPVTAMLYAYWRRMRPLYATLDTLVAAYLITIPSLVWTYAGMSLALPLADAKLIAMDRAMHFDWWSFISYVDHRPRLARLLGLAYGSFTIQFFLVPMWLAISGRGVRACALLFCYALLCLLSSILGALVPGAWHLCGLWRRNRRSHKHQRQIRLLLPRPVPCGPRPTRVRVKAQPGRGYRYLSFCPRRLGRSLRLGSLGQPCPALPAPGAEYPDGDLGGQPCKPLYGRRDCRPRHRRAHDQYRDLVVLPPERGRVFCQRRRRKASPCTCRATPGDHAGRVTRRSVRLIRPPFLSSAEVDG